MAVDSNKFPAGFNIFVLFSILASVAVSSSSQAEETNRNQCVDGTYKHDGRDCCLCAAGLQVVKHCITGLHDGKCDTCDRGTYSSHPNDRMVCEPCTSCSHLNGNLEVEEPCTSARDAKCRCQKDHYCVSGIEVCKLCNPCKKCGAEGIKVSCSGNNNTVCNDKIEGGIQGGAIVGIIFAILLFICAVATVFIYRKKLFCWRQHTPVSLSNGTATDVEMQPFTGKKSPTPLPEVDLQPHLSDIAGVIGWKVMKDVAMRSGILSTRIDSCELDHPGDSEEQTLKLLKIWVESKGREAPNELIKILQDSGKKSKAEKVTDIMSRGNS